MSEDKNNDAFELEDAISDLINIQAQKSPPKLQKPQNSAAQNSSDDEFNLENAVSAIMPDSIESHKQQQKQKEETFQAKMNLFLKKNGSTIAKFGIALIVIAVLIYIFYPREDAIVIDLPIPYVYYNPFKEALNMFSHLDCHNEVLLVRGKRGIGKSRGLSTFADNLRADNRFVINFDFDRLHKYSNNNDIVDLIRNSVIQGLRDLDGKTYRSINIKYSLAAIDGISEVFKTNKTRMIRPIYDQYLRQVAYDLMVIIAQIPKGANFGLNLFFECIQIISPSLRPIIIINSPEKLYRINTNFSNEVYHTIIKSFQKLSHDTINYGIIVEVSDEEWLQTQLSEFRSSIYRWINVREFDIDSAKQQLTGRGMFKTSQITDLYKEFGGYGPDYAHAHELMRSGFSFDEAINVIRTDLSDVYRLNSTSLSS